MCCQHITENIHKKFGRQYGLPFGGLYRQRLLELLIRLFKLFKMKL